MTDLEVSWPVGEAPAWPGYLQSFGERELYVRRSRPSSHKGPQEAAVLVHGLGGQSTNWTDLMGLLRNRIEQVAFDLPGFGWSPPPVEGDYSMRAFTEAARSVVADRVAASGAPVHLFGNSLGGAIAVRIAATSPHLVKSLVLTSPALPDLVPRKHTLGVPLVALPRVGEAVWRRLARVPPERQVRAMVDLNFGNPAVVSATRRAEAVADYRRRFTLPYAGEALSASARGLLSSFMIPGRQNLWRQAAEVRCPTLVIYGGRDRLVRPQKALRFARTMPSARVVVLPQVGHVPQLEAPLLVAQLVSTFLDDHWKH